MISSSNRIGYGIGAIVATVVLVALLSNETTARIMYWIGAAFFVIGLLWMLNSGVKSNDEKTRKISTYISVVCTTIILIILFANIRKIPYYFGKTYTINNSTDLKFAEKNNIPVVNARIDNPVDTGNYLTEQILIEGQQPSENGGTIKYWWYYGEIGGYRRLIRVAPGNYVQSGKRVTLCVKDPDDYDKDIARSIYLNSTKTNKVYYCDNKVIGEITFVAGLYVIGVLGAVGFLYCAINGIKRILGSKNDNDKHSKNPRDEREKTQTDSAEAYYESKWKLLAKSIGYPLDEIVFTRDEINGTLMWESDVNELYKVTYHIFKHLKISTWFTLRVIYDDQVKKAGTYNKEKGVPTITINLKKHFTHNQIFAVLCHECAHHYLRAHNIELKNTSENEVLTDVACVYLGMGGYLLEGYYPVDEVNGNQRTTHTLGYINTQRIEKLLIWWKRDKTIEKFEKYESEQKERRTNELQAKMQIYKDIVSRSKSAYDSIRSYKGIVSEDDIVVLQEFVQDMEYVSYEHLIDKCELYLKDEKDNEELYLKLLEELNEKSTVLTYRCSVLSKYL